jgi:hypothetical protein
MLFVIVVVLNVHLFVRCTASGYKCYQQDFGIAALCCTAVNCVVAAAAALAVLTGRCYGLPSLALKVQQC